MREETQLDSEWNYGVQYLWRISNLENAEIVAMIEGDYDRSFLLLKRLYIELSRRMKPAEKEKAQELIKAVNKYLEGQPDTPRESYFGVANGYPVTKLEELSMYLKGIITARGMDLPTKDDPGQAILE